MVWPETDSAVQTIPAMAITKNMPVVPESPNRSSTTAEMMMVSIVIPETGFRAVVAMAFAATEAKKKEKTTVSARPHSDHRQGRVELSQENRHADCAENDSDEDRDRGDVPVRALQTVRRALCGKSARRSQKEPATILSDLMMPKIPAVAIVPTPMKRT